MMISEGDVARSSRRVVSWDTKSVLEEEGGR
jgi:hypothetical protein